MIKIILLALLLSGCSQKSIEINNRKIDIEIADTNAKREQGLSGRTSLCGNCGMLFVFDKPGIYPFWMKDMNFSLDFIFINQDKIVDIKENISPATYPNIINSNFPHDKVLEVNAGYAANKNYKIGQTVALTNK